MLLVSYSDSDASDAEAPSPPKPAVQPPAKPSSSKPAFQKLIDRDNPHKLMVNLPVSGSRSGPVGPDGEGPPAKRAKRGGGGLSGFSDMLPAPKKRAQPRNPAASKGLGPSFGSGFSMKTGARPVFSRKSADASDDESEMGQVQPMKASHDTPATVLDQPATATDSGSKKPEYKPFNPRFVPLSVTRQGKAKKPMAPPPQPGTMRPPAEADPKPAAKPEVSLFSFSAHEQIEPADSSTEPYQPLFATTDGPTEASEAPEAQAGETGAGGGGKKPQVQSLESIADELNLSAAEKRQLLGRKHGATDQADPASLRMVEFNTDAEYAHNEQLRATGETTEHHALKSISGTGKNSLRSLVSTAITQRDALEEHFAASHRNKKEAGRRYGW